MSEYVFKNATPQGWQCPVCGRVHNPVQMECPYCEKGRDILGMPKNPLNPPFDYKTINISTARDKNITIWYSSTT